MAVDREQWAERFDQLPHWRCPTCNKGHLIPIDNKIWFEETGPSAEAHDHDAWEPDWVLNRFAGFVRCNMPGCGEVCSISGTSPTDFFEYQDEFEHYQDAANRFVVRSIDPTPLPIQLPEAAPELVIDAIRSASTLVWPSAEAAGNQLRQAVEALMDDAGISALDSKGKRIPLHDRIVAFDKTDKENGQVLLAVKWLGNSGSHPGGLTREDVLDAFDMIEFVLENLYGTTKKELLAKVAAINAQKGPVKPSP
jgi:hypothetical protein